MQSISKLKYKLKRAYLFCAEKLSEDISFFIISFFLMSVGSVIFYIQDNEADIAVWVLNYNILISFLVTVLVNTLSGKIRKIFKNAILVILLLYCFIESLCLIVYDRILDFDTVAIFLGSNTQEIEETFLTYFSPWMALAALVYIGISGFVIWLCNKSFKISQMNTKIFMIEILTLILLLPTNQISFKKSFVGIIAQNISRNAFVEDIISPDIDICITDSIQPQNIVLIIGESFTKTHSSTYGYDKPTNPKLDAMCRDSVIFAYKNITAPAVNTIEAFKRILSTINEDEDEPDWNTKPNILSIIRDSGYETYWISNQSKHGIYDNIITKYAELCNHVYFTSNKDYGRNRYLKKGSSVFDGALLNYLDKTATDTVPQFIIYHLIGQHHKFALRYPDEFKKFKKKDYKSYPKHQRQKLADYDNATLYNDYVVSEIFKNYKDSESIVIYFPDHGVDIYESDPDFVGHAKKNNEASEFVAKQIPFFVYVSPKYKEKFPGMVEKIQQNVNRTFCTDDMLYTIMDIAGVKFPDNDDVEKRSLFR